MTSGPPSAGETEPGRARHWLVFAAIMGAATAVAFLWPAVYVTQAVVRLEPGVSSTKLDSPERLSERFQEALLVNSELEVLARQLAPDSRDTAEGRERVRSAIQVVPEAEAFAVRVSGGDPVRVQQVANQLADRLVERVPRLLGGGSGADESSELEEPTRALAAFLAAHPEVAAEPPPATATATAPDRSLDVLRVEKGRVEKALAEAAKQGEQAASDNPYEEPAPDVNRLKRRLTELKTVIAAREKAPVRAPRAAKISPELAAEWQRLIQAVVEARKARPERPASSTPRVTARVVTQAPLPTSPARPNRTLLLGVGLMLALGASALSVLASKLRRRPAPKAPTPETRPPRSPILTMTSSWPPPESPQVRRLGPSSPPLAGPPQPVSSQPPAAVPAPVRTYASPIPLEAPPAEPQPATTAQTLPLRTTAPETLVIPPAPVPRIEMPPPPPEAPAAPASAEADRPPSTPGLRASKRPPSGAGGYSYTAARASQRPRSPVPVQPGSESADKPSSRPSQRGIRSATAVEATADQGALPFSEYPRTSSRPDWVIEASSTEPQEPAPIVPRIPSPTPPVGSLLSAAAQDLRRRRTPVTLMHGSLSDVLTAEAAAGGGAAPSPFSRAPSARFASPVSALRGDGGSTPRAATADRGTANGAPKDAADWAPPPALLGQGWLVPLRDMLERRTQAGPLVVVVSGPPQDQLAKSRFAAELALCCAESGRRRVLLLEGDFGKPHVHRTLDLEVPAKSGFSEQIEARVRGEAVQAWSVVACTPALHVLCENDARSPHLLQTFQFEGAIAELRNGYDLVLIDAPTVDSAVAMRALECIADGFVLFAATAGAARAASAEDPLLAVKLLALCAPNELVK